MTRWLRWRSRADRVAAGMLLACTSPLVALCAVLVRRYDGGRAFITVDRVGRGGRVFAMWKLRSMRPDTESGRAAGVTLTGAGDERITPVGRWLREMHLDELPQLWNVVKGEMTLLGPRPEAPEWVSPGDRRWTAVLECPPGMAGPTQLVVDEWEQRVIAKDPSGDAYLTEVLPVKLEIDAWYLRSSSPVLDACVALTFASSLLPGGRWQALARRITKEVPAARGTVGGGHKGRALPRASLQRVPLEARRDGRIPRVPPPSPRG